MESRERNRGEIHLSYYFLKRNGLSITFDFLLAIGKEIVRI